VRAFAVERVDSRTPDLVLVLSILLLVGTGLSALFTASYFRADTLFEDPYHFLQKQALWVLVGFGLAFLCSRISLELTRRLLPVLMLFSFVLMILTFVPGIGARFLGARRWVFLFGYSFQPSELVKVALVIYLAFILSRKQDQLHDPVNALLPPVIMVGIFATLIYLQNDFSTAAFVVVLALAIFFVAGVPIRYFISLAVMVVPIGVLLLLTKAHRVERVIAFLEPEQFPTSLGYQILAARRALRDGGFWGEGIGESAAKFGRLPEAHSDFVFAVFAEEVGFLGVVVVVLLFGLFAYRGFRIAALAPDTFTSLLAFGLTGVITFQALLNAAVVSGVVPATGIPLPFFSSGGSSILMTLVACGLLLNVSRYAHVPEGQYG
jgi:cell division protein FtsW